MREIKVRGYALEKLITDTQWLVGFGVCEIKFADHYAKEVGRISDWWIYTENGEYLVDPKSIGEYTGLKDKNGKEIYEGDIIKSSLGCVATVEWEEEGRFLGFTAERDIIYVNREPAVEVIGNIFEDGDLLNDNKEPKTD